MSTSSASNRGKCILVWRRRRSVLIILDIRVAVAAVNYFSAADNTTLELRSGSNFCTGPNDCVLHDGVCLDGAVGADNRKSFDPRFRVQQRVFRDQLRPTRLCYVGRFPSVIQDRSMDLEVFATRSDVEPLALIQNDSADLRALLDPVHQNWDERNLLACGDS